MLTISRPVVICVNDGLNELRKEVNVGCLKYNARATLSGRYRQRSALYSASMLRRRFNAVLRQNVLSPMSSCISFNIYV